MLLFLLLAQPTQTICPSPNTSYPSLKLRSLPNLWSLEISKILSLTFEDIICLLSHCVGILGSLCFLTCVWMGWRKIERTIQAKHFFWKLINKDSAGMDWSASFLISLGQPWLGLLQPWGPEHSQLWSLKEPITGAVPADDVNTCYNKRGCFISNLNQTKCKNIKILHKSWVPPFSKPGSPVLRALW